MPGDDVVQACALVVGELDLLPHLPELPARGAGADMIGRSAGLLVDLPVELVPSGWRFTAHDGRDVRRARDFLDRDLDALEAATDGYTGVLKVQATGPWTLAASVELVSGHKVVSDPGAVRDLCESLAAGVAAHVADVGRRVPGARVVLQLDEPSLSAVLAGEVATPSGYGSVRSVDRNTVADRLRSVLEVAPEGCRVVHCCAPNPPLEILASVGLAAVALDADLIGVEHLDRLGEAVEAGTSLWLGCLPALDAPVSAIAVRERVSRLWSDLGFPRELVASRVVVTPSCGLAGASPAHAKRVLSTLREVSRWLVDEAGG